MPSPRRRFELDTTLTTPFTRASRPGRSAVRPARPKQAADCSAKVRTGHQRRQPGGHVGGRIVVEVAQSVVVPPRAVAHPEQTAPAAQCRKPRSEFGRLGQVAAGDPRGSPATRRCRAAAGPDRPQPRWPRQAPARRSSWGPSDWSEVVPARSASRAAARRDGYVPPTRAKSEGRRSGSAPPAAPAGAGGSRSIVGRPAMFPAAAPRHGRRRSRLESARSGGSAGGTSPPALPACTTGPERRGRTTRRTHP